MRPCAGASVSLYVFLMFYCSLIGSLFCLSSKTIHGEYKVTKKQKRKTHSRLVGVTSKFQLSPHLCLPQILTLTLAYSPLLCVLSRVSFHNKTKPLSLSLSSSDLLVSILFSTRFFTVTETHKPLLLLLLLFFLILLNPRV